MTGVSSSSSSNGKANAIPANTRKMVQGLKEIVNCSEHDIYAMLKECNMDPNDAVQRLLSQDPFHEVKSRREKKKEMKENTESKSQGMINASNRGGKGATDRGAGRGSSAHFNSSEYGGLHGRLTNRKENGASAVPSYSDSVCSTRENNINQGSKYLSDSVSAEKMVKTVTLHENASLSLQPSSGFQPTWLGAPGQLSMADIVRSGRPHVKGPTVKQPPVSATPHTQGLSAKVSEINHEPEISLHPPQLSGDDWPVIDQSSSATPSSFSEPSSASVAYADPSTSSSLYVDISDLRLSSRLDELLVKEGNVSIETLDPDCTGSALGSDVQIAGENSEGHSTCFDENPIRNRSSYPSQRLGLEHPEGIGGNSQVSLLDYGVSSSIEDVRSAMLSTAANLQKLSFRNEELGTQHSEDNPAVIIPNHLQVSTADYSHLSFGSFQSGINAAFPTSFASTDTVYAQKSNLEQTSVRVDAPSIEQSDTGSAEYYNNEQLRSASNENVDPRTGSGVRSYDSSSSPNLEVAKDDTADTSQGHPYPFPSSMPNYQFENAPQTNAASYSYAQTSSQMQNLGPLSSVMVGKSSVFSTPQQALQILPSNSISAVPALSQHVPVHPYSEPTALPLGPFGSVFNYPYLPQSFTFMPSAFQQAYIGNSGYHHSPASAHNGGIKYTLPQYKNSISVSSLPHSAPVPAGYGGFGGSVNIPGAFTLNPSASTGSTTSSYDDILSSQYKDSNHYLPVQQNESSAMWVHGRGSRTVSAPPASSFHNFQEQNQHSGFRQTQQPSHYSALGYQNFYHSQSGVSQVGPGHQQTLSDGNPGGSQGPIPSHQSHQLWAHSY